MHKIDEKRRLLKVGALAGTAAFLCHCWVDFNWQIPADQLYFVALLVVMGMNSANEKPTHKEGPEASSV